MGKGGVVQLHKKTLKVPFSLYIETTFQKLHWHSVKQEKMTRSATRVLGW